MHYAAASTTSFSLLFCSYANMKYSHVITSHEAESLVPWQKTATEIERDCCSPEGSVWHCIESSVTHTYDAPTSYQSASRQ